MKSPSDRIWELACSKVDSKCSDYEWLNARLDAITEFLDEQWREELKGGGMQANVKCEDCNAFVGLVVGGDGHCSCGGKYVNV